MPQGKQNMFIKLDLEAINLTSLIRPWIVCRGSPSSMNTILDQRLVHDTNKLLTKSADRESASAKQRLHSYTKQQTMNTKNLEIPACIVVSMT